MMGPLRRIGAWLEDRLGLVATLGPMMRHPAPAGARWWYVFGSATLTLFVIQIITGICLALVYVPAPDQAFDSLEYLNYQQYLGWFLRAVHNWAASGMVAMVFVHMTQVFLFGAYKYPREMTWLVGVGLLAMTLGMAFTGQVLRWDQDAYWGVGVGASMAGRVPWLGPYVVDLLLGGPQIGAATLSRFFALHVFVIPGLLIGLLVLHLYLVLYKGISEPPIAGKPVNPATYHEEYEKALAQGEPFYPDVVWRDGIFSFLTVLVVVALAYYFGPAGPSSIPDPTLIHNTNPRPDWPFLWLFALLALSPPEAETFIMLVLPVLLFGILIVIPFVSWRGERSPKRRPVAVLTVIVVFVSFVVLTYLGATAPWSPVMMAWSSDPIPEKMLAWKVNKDDKEWHQLSPLEMQGAVVLQYKDCRNCHALDGLGGKRGPDLNNVALRLTHDELVRQVTQGGGNMPAYGKQLSASEVTALVAFLDTLRPPGQPPAREPLGKLAETK
jgi:ubiquinol-cytochrome c reductase cytochrome b subunit